MVLISLTLTQYRRVSRAGLSSYQLLCTTAQLWRFPSRRKPNTERQGATPCGPTARRPSPLPSQASALSLGPESVSASPFRSLCEY